jgi:hypothetical protein
MRMFLSQLPYRLLGVGRNRLIQLVGHSEFHHYVADLGAWQRFVWLLELRRWQLRVTFPWLP